MFSSSNVSFEGGILGVHPPGGHTSLVRIIVSQTTFYIVNVHCLHKAVQRGLFGGKAI